MALSSVEAGFSVGLCRLCCRVASLLHRGRLLKLVMYYHVGRIG